MKTLKQIMLGTTASVGLVLGAAVSTTAVLAPVASAQSYTTGAVQGTVVDTAGNPVAGATVRVVDTARGSVRSATTGADGSFFVGRLAVGNHSITISRDGYQSISDDAVRVSVGSTSDYTFALAAGSSTDDVITVTGTAVQANTFQVAETGLTIDVDEIFEQIPVGRDIDSLAQLAPGTVAGDTAFGGTSIGGSSVGENAFYINGMNVTNFRNFLGASTIPFQFYEQVEVKTGGYQAEFGRSTGGVVNAVTRSGTNEFHWGFNIFYSPDELREDSPNTFSQTNDQDQRTSQEMNIYASGPIVEDRVFFYAMYSPRNFEYVNSNINFEQTSGQRFETVDEDPFWGIKLDANLFEGHTLGLTAFSDDRRVVTNTYDIGYDSYEDRNVVSESYNGEGYSLEGGDIFIANYTGELTDWATLSITYGQQTFGQTSKSSADDLPATYRYETGTGFIRQGDWVNFSISEGEDSRELFRADLDLFANFMGEHQIRIGVDREELTADASVINSGGAYYLYGDGAYCDIYRANGGVALTGDPCVRWRDYSVGGSFTTIQTAFYIQDSWQLTDQLTLNLGLRNETFDNRNSDDETFTEITNQLAPRIQAAYDVWGDGNLELFGSWGRYYLPVATNTNIRMAGGETYIHRWYDYSAVDANFVPTFVGGVAGNFYEQVFGDGSVPDTRSTTDANLDPMYVDEIILGGRWTMNDLWDFGLSFTHRDLGSTLEDVAIDAAVIAYCDANGIDVGGTPCSDVWSGFHQYVLTNPGEDMNVYLPELDQQVELSAADLGYPAAERTYTALELTFDRQFDNGWDLHGSWTISSSEGNYEGSVKSDNGQDDAGITQDFDQPGLTDGANGDLPNHRTHKFKLWGSYQVNEMFTVGGRFNATSPRSFGCIGYHPTDAFAYEYGASSWYCGGELTPRGSQLESDWTYNFDLSFIYRPTNLPYPGEPTLRMDIFNVLNADGVTDIYEFGDSSATAPGVVPYVNEANPRYGMASGYQAPRSVRFGLSWDF